MSNTASVRDPSKLQRQIASQILRHVQTNDLPEGTHLTELGLAHEFKVSRTPIRAALEYLAEQGFVTQAPRRGFAVTQAATEAELDHAKDISEDDKLYPRDRS